MTDFQLQPDCAEFKIGFDFEDAARADGYTSIAGIDEVGRGCLAGPVVAAACILDRTRPVHKNLNDSKKLSAKQREEIAAELRETVVAYGFGQIEADEIDRVNIAEATRRAMSLAISALSIPADFLLIDAMQLRAVPLSQRAVIKGDAISYSIAAASVLAKTYRDELMRSLDTQFPQYGFASHKGYGSAAHLAALRTHGPCNLHRTTFRGVISF